ncbi:MAG: LysM peptidoglycan-binding domain-containing protein [Dehalococcoidia bacterium]
MRIAAPATGILLFIAACGGGDSPFDADDPTATALSASQSPRDTATPTPSACATEYEVKDGDTLLDIALTHDVTIEAIVDASNLPDANTLSIGQKLMIPCAQPTPSPTATSTATPEPT